MKKLILCGFFIFSTFLATGQDKSKVSEDLSLDSIVVASTRAGKNTPTAHTTVSREQIKAEASNHSLPMMLSLQPSVVTTVEGGLGLGYSKLSVRGTDASRINVTVNGIAMNDSESQEVFWVNMPSIQNFLNSVQLQRGVGTTANGPASFGASINMQTTPAAMDAYGRAEFSFGSYSTYMTSVAAGTGVSKSGFSFDVSYSRGTTDGYIRNAKADLNSLFATAGWRNANNSIKLNYIYGEQHTGITWEGISLEDYYSNRRYNPAGEYYDEAGNVHYYDNETDNYVQHHLQAIYTHQFSPRFTWNTTLNFTKGDGYYENYKASDTFREYGLAPQIIEGVTYDESDFIIREAMDNSYYAAMTSVTYRTSGFNAVAGASYSFYDGDHIGKMLWSKYNQNIPDDYRWYLNNGRKEDASVYARAEWSISSRLTLFADMQYRYIEYKLKGPDDDFVLLDNNRYYSFFNPKGGLSFNLSPRSRFYASVAVSHREPSRSDIKESIKSGTEERLESERLIDYEIGYNYSAPKLTLMANLYFMEYKNQLVATGRLTDVGYVIKENIPDSYRRGIELAAAWSPLKWLKVDANLTLSKNELKNFTNYVDTYDNDTDWNPVEQTALFYKKSKLTLSPEVISMAMISVRPVESAGLSLSCKYVGEQYMDNSSSEIARVPGYYTASFNSYKDFTLKNDSRIRVSFSVDNLFNNRYYSYGWIYRARFADGAPDYVEQGVYPQATINFVAKVAYSF